MLKALFKKQLFEVNSFIIQNKKTGELRSKNGIILMALLYVALFGLIGSMFYWLATMLCSAMVSSGIGWLYFAIMGLISILFGVFGSVFSTYSSLYNAKDNEMLLSMPIPAASILAVRLFGVWLWGFVYEAIVFIPTLYAYWENGNASVLSVISGILLMFVVSIFILTLSCLFGWVVAKISSKLKNKSFITVIISLAFFGAYYYVYFKANEIISGIIANAQAMSEDIKATVYPIYWFGHAGEGDMLSLLFIVAIVAVLFVCVYAVMAHSFIKMATTNKGAKKKKYREADVKQKSKGTALVFKELRRFTSSSAYMLNCGLGAVILLILGVTALFNIGFIDKLISSGMFSQDMAVLIACAGLCLLASMCIITAPSVSLEGKNLWLVQSFPVSPWQALKAKLKLHLIIAEIPVAFCAVCMIIVLRPSVLSAVMIIVLPMLFVLLSAAFGLALNLKSPNLKWTDEIVPIKQSMSVTVAYFGGWGVVLLLGGLYFAVKSFLSAEAYLTVCAVLIACTAVWLTVWIKKKGTKIFEAL